MWVILEVSVLHSLSLVTLVAVTSAVEPEVTVTGCSSASAFTRALEELVGEEVVHASAASIRVHSNPSEGSTPKTWTTTLDIAGDNTLRRTLVAETCEAGMEAAVVVAAMALDPQMLMSGAREDEWVREQPRPVPPPPKQPPPTTPEPEPEPSALEGRPDAREPATLGWEFELGAGGSLGTLPVGNGLVRGGIAARWKWLSVRAGATYAWPRTVDVNDSASARVQLWAATVGACYVATLAEQWDAPLCVAGHLGRMYGTGRGEGVRSRSGSATWGAAGLGASMRWWPTPHVGLYAGFEGLGVFARPDLVIEGEGRACCSSPVALSGSLGPTFRL